jgi:hypothetical protein
MGFPPPLGQSEAGNDDVSAPVAPAAPIKLDEVTESPPPSSAHCDTLARRPDAVTLALAAIEEAPAPPTDNPPPRVRPTLSIVRVVVDTYTTAREWLARERPIDYGN